MSTISSIHDAIGTKLATLFAATHTEMVNPYIPELNDNLTLRRSYGYYMAPATASNRQLDCYISVQRTVSITLSIANRGTERDVTLRKTAEKTLLEDFVSLIKALEKDASLGTLCARFMYESDSGIEFIVTEQDNYLMIRCNFIFEYLESNP